MKKTLYWVWFSRINNLGSIRKQELLKRYKIEEIWNLDKEELLQVSGIGDKTADEILDKKYKQGLDDIISKMQKENIKLINIEDGIYPEKLKNIYDKPISLYAKGNIEILKDFSLAVIGCRENSVYGEKVAKAVTKGIVQNKVVTISGLAKGIDSICHKETLRNKGKTIAVIGSSLDIIYPFENKGLAEEIVKNGGCIVSEYPLGTKPEKMNFPARNRIISGLSDGVVVVEATKSSGSLITAEFGMEQGREIFAVPGNIFNPASEGTNELIRDGATIVLSSKEIIEEIK